MGDGIGIRKLLDRVTGAGKWVSAVIVAAGSGTRMAETIATTKQLFVLDGIPVVARSLLAFERCEMVNEIVLVCREDEKSVMRALRDEYGIHKLKTIVSGGATRQESVMAGFEAVSSKTDFVAIHDGARCLVTPEIICRVLREAFATRAASAACGVTDTVKTVTADRTVSETLDRNRVMLVQTPQCFYADLYRAAAYTAREKGWKATDDCALCETAGFAVKLVDCGRENIKITTPQDIPLAEFYLSRREEKTI